VAGDPSILTSWSFEPFQLGAVALVAVAYGKRARTLAARGTPVPSWRMYAFAVGLLLAALQHAGLATLTHTPSPMRFLNDVCDRPPEERPNLVIPVGYPADDARVPDLARKSLAEVMVRA
jgi:hypothetical protein